MLKLIRVVVFVFLFTCLGGTARAAGKLFCFNTSDQLFSGNIWVATNSTGLERCLNQYPGQWGCLVLGVTNQEIKNGEILGWGTVNNHRFFWVNPEYPFTPNPLENQKINLALLAVFDGGKGQRIKLEKGAVLEKTLINEMKKRSLSLAAVEVQGTLKNVNYSIAFNLPKAGVNFKNLTENMIYFDDKELAYWHLCGLYAEGSEAQKAIALAGPLRLSGLATKTGAGENKKIIQKGGQINGALVEEAEAVIYPLDGYKIFHAQLGIVSQPSAGGKISFKVTNDSPLWVEHVLVEGFSGLEKKFSFRLMPLGSFSSQPVLVEVPSFGKDGLVVLVNGKKEIFEENYDNNQLGLAPAKATRNESVIVYVREDTLWQINSDGRGFKKIAGLDSDSGKIFRNPVWAPNRLNLAFYSFSKWSAPAVALLTPPQPTIFLYNFSTGHLQPLFKPATPKTVVDDLCFSSEGDFLYFTLSRADVGESVVRLNLANLRLEPVIEGGFQPDLSANGKNLVYVAYNYGFKNIVLLNPESKEKKILVSYGQFVDLASPRFNPKADKIIFGAVLPNQERPLWQLWLYDLNRQTLEKVLEQNSAEPYKVCWGPDGRKIVYGSEGRLFIYEFDRKPPRFLASGEAPDWY